MRRCVRYAFDPILDQLSHLLHMIAISLERGAVRGEPQLEWSIRIDVRRAFRRRSYPSIQQFSYNSQVWIVVAAIAAEEIVVRRHLLREAE